MKSNTEDTYRHIRFCPIADLYSVTIAAVDKHYRAEYVGHYPSLSEAISARDIAEVTAQ